MDLTDQWQKDHSIGKTILEGELAYEMALISVTKRDIDRAKDFSQLAFQWFLKQWNELGPYARDSKHLVLQSV